nr:ATP-dependent RNA helicase ddx54 [Polyrhizophydium stewartii]
MACAADYARVIEAGSRRRAVAETNMNATSSRSHAVLTLTIEQHERLGEDASSGSSAEYGARKRSKIHLIDLAGSERADTTGATGARLKEGSSINQSLSSLGNVISALAARAQHVPFRDSKLTYLLSDALGANALVAVVAPDEAEEAVEAAVEMLFTGGRESEPGAAAPSAAKLAKQERQRAKYKKNKKDAGAGEDSDFETVPAESGAGARGGRVDPEEDGWESGSDLDRFNSASEGEDAEMDSVGDAEMDDAGSASDGDDGDQPSDGDNEDGDEAQDDYGQDESDQDDDGDDDDDREKSEIARQVKSANRKGKKSGGFQSMGLSYPVYKAIIQQGFKVPTPIQRKTIPIVMEGRDVVAMARTGSGKTAAFLIPMLERLKAHSAKVGARALVLSPSRELATQTHKVCRDLSRFTDLRACVFVGGDHLEDQFTALAGNPDIIVATPGRLMHLMVEMSMDMRTIEVVVFDEADRLFEMGFAEQLHEILHRLPATRQTMLFSATLPRQLVEFARAGLQNPALVRLDVDAKIPRDLQMYFMSVKSEDKDGALLYLFRHCIPEEQQTVVFVSTKHRVEYVHELLVGAGLSSTYIYGALDQAARKIHLAQFRGGKRRILVVTDVAARGIDVPLLDNVVNYDFPAASKVFVHRVGRTARAGRRGAAWSLVAADELPFMLDLQLFTSRPLVFASALSDGTTVREPDYAGELVYGMMPPSALSLEVEAVAGMVGGSATLQALGDSARRGHQMYLRSRPTATKGAYARAKDIATQYIGVHPLFAAKMEKNELERMAMVQQLSRFRPAETVFEVGRRGLKSTEATLMIKRRGELAGRIQTSRDRRAEAEAREAASQASAVAARGIGGDAMDEADLAGFDVSLDSRKRAAQPGDRPAKRAKPAKEYRDTEHYLAYRPADADTEAGYAVGAGQAAGSFAMQAGQAALDMVGDEPEMAAKAGRGALRWDAKKHKFVRATIGADNQKVVRTEAGTAVPASFKSGRFERWQKRTHTEVPRAGERELADAAARAAGAGRTGGARVYRHNRTTAPRADSKAFARRVASMEAAWRREGKPAAEIAKLRTGVVTAARDAHAAEQRAADVAQRARKAAGSELKSAAQIAKARAEKQRRREKTGRHAHVLAAASARAKRSK